MAKARAGQQGCFCADLVSTASRSSPRRRATFYVTLNTPLALSDAFPNAQHGGVYPEPVEGPLSVWEFFDAATLKPERVECRPKEVAPTWPRPRFARRRQASRKFSSNAKANCRPKPISPEDARRTDQKAPHPEPFQRAAGRAQQRPRPSPARSTPASGSPARGPARWYKSTPGTHPTNVVARP